MGQVIPMPGDPHHEVQALLPWYMNGTLDAGEVAAVEAHLAGCAECRQDLAAERAINREAAAVPLDVERGWMAMRARIERQTATTATAPEAAVVPLRKGLLRRSIPMGWALAAQAAAVLLIVGGAHLARSPAADPAPVYHALSSPRPGMAGNIVVVFRPDTHEQDLRGAVVASGGELVGGPTASDAYLLHVAPPRRAAALARLRADRHIVLAEPIGGLQQ